MSAYPLNCWYVAAASEDVAATLLARQVAGHRIVLFRRADGIVGALEDRCAHRSAPLSMGSLVDDAVVCAYHGFAYSSDGACVRVPSQLHVPYGASVRSFPVREDGPFVWVWLGNPARANATEPPVLAPLRDPGWTVLGGTMHMAANYMLLHDNALDRTHFPFVHAHRIHAGYVEDPPPLQVEVSETQVSYSRTFTPVPLAQWQAAATGLAPSARYVQRETGTFVSPALHVDEMEIIGPDSRAFSGVFVRAFTPVDPDHTMIIWRAARNYALEDESVSQRLREVYEGTMVEDQPLLEAIQAQSGSNGHDVSAVADAPAIRAYQIVERMLDEERGPSHRGRPMPS